MIGAAIGFVAALIVAGVGFLLVLALERATRRRPFHDALEELVWMINGGGSLAIPRNDRLIAELCAYKPWFLGDTSPDMGDAIMLAFESNKRHPKG